MRLPCTSFFPVSGHLVTKRTLYPLVTPCHGSDLVENSYPLFPTVDFYSEWLKEQRDGVGQLSKEFCIEHRIFS